MKIKLIIMILIVFLSACTKTETVYVDRVTEVPILVEVPFKRPPVIQPIGDLPTKDLPVDAAAKDKVDALAKAVQILKNKIKQYQEALKPYYK